MRTPNLSTIQMIKETIEENDSKYSIYQLWKNLPKKIMYQTYKKAIEYLQQNNQITIKQNKLKTINQNKQTKYSRNDILYSLSKYGYDLITKEKIKGRLIEKEKLIIEILLNFPEARFIEAIPFMIKKSNKFELYRLAKNHDLINKIGFLTEATEKIYKKDLKELKTQLKKQKTNKIQFLTTIKDKKYLNKHTPKIMKDWNLRGLFSLNDFKKDDIY